MIIAVRALGAQAARNRLIVLPVFVAAAAVLAGAGLAGVGGGAARVSAQDVDDGPSHIVELEPGWNLVGWTGDEAAASEALSFAGALSQPAYSFDATAQAFRTYEPGLPASLNSLQELEYGTAVWVFAEEPVEWRQPAVVSARDVALVAGFNLVTWTGPTQTLVADAAASIASDLAAVYWYDARAGRYLTYRPGSPAAFSDLRVVHYGEALWVLMEGAAVWQQPDALASRCAPFPNSESSLGEWVTFEAGAVRLEYQEGSAAEAGREAVAASALAALGEVEARVAIAADTVVRVRLYENAALLQAATGPRFFAFAEPPTGTIHIRCGSSSLGVVQDLPSLHHELAHIVTVREHGGNALFLAEGIAAWVDGKIGALPLSWWADAGRQRRYPSAAGLLTDARYLARPDTSAALATAALLTRYLIEERGGLESFWVLWAVAQVAGIERAADLVYGASWDALDGEMREALGILG